ncbi:MAG: PilZ domain-containing protein [Planctomycetes bacterium]|nr:PilZ domain-containing protein [Planctomycetota bacterium]
MSQDRRIHSRIRTRLPARLVRGAESVEGVVENVGQGGVFFATETLEVALDDGTDVEVEFEAWRGEQRVQLRLPSTILRAERYFDGTVVVRAFAIRFQEPIDISTYRFE